MLAGRRPDLLLFLAAEAVSATGSSAAPVALTFALFARGAGAGQVGTVLAAQALPMALLMLLGGVLADRFAPRRVMMAADLLRAAAQAVQALLLMQKEVPILAIVLLAALLGTGTALAAPGRNRLLTQIVPAAGLLRANGMLMAATSAAGLLGPALGGALVATAGAASAILLDALSYVASAPFLLGIRGARGNAGDADPPMLDALRDGWSEFTRRRWVWLMVCLFSLLHLASWGPTEVLGAQAFAHRATGARGWGLLLSLMGAGALMGGLAALYLRPVRPIRAVLLWLLVYPLLPWCLAAALPFPLQGACFFLGGLEMANVNVLWESTLQRAIPPERLSRVSAYDALGSFCLLPLGYALAGPLALVVGPSRSLWLGGLLVLLCTLTLLAVPGVRNGARLLR